MIRFPSDDLLSKKSQPILGSVEPQVDHQAQESDSLRQLPTSAQCLQIVPHLDCSNMLLNFGQEEASPFQPRRSDRDRRAGQRQDNSLSIAPMCCFSPDLSYLSSNQILGPFGVFPMTNHMVNRRGQQGTPQIFERPFLFFDCCALEVDPRSSATISHSLSWLHTESTSGSLDVF